MMQVGDYVECVFADTFPGMNPLPIAKGEVYRVVSAGIGAVNGADVVGIETMAGVRVGGPREHLEVSRFRMLYRPSPLA